MEPLSRRFFDLTWTVVSNVSSWPVLADGDCLAVSTDSGPPSCRQGETCMASMRVDSRNGDSFDVVCGHPIDIHS
jgi:hypothetical protein